jgi:hypothetical protein
MGIEAEFGNGTVKNAVMSFYGDVEAQTIYLLSYLGEGLVKYAIEKRTYTDQTSNLTNSIGYAVAQGGKPVYYGGFIQPGEGQEAGLKVAMEMAAKTPSTFSLIIVAGMDYAAYVEDMGYNVILPAELKARTDFPAAMKRLAEMAKNKANELFGNIL